MFGIKACMRKGVGIYFPPLLYFPVSEQPSGLDPFWSLPASCLKPCDATVLLEQVEEDSVKDLASEQWQRAAVLLLTAACSEGEGS